MTRGHRRQSQQRQNVSEPSKRSPPAAASVEPGFAVRSLAVNALACTSAAVSVLTPVHAVTLGEITVDSALGQPLDARVPVTLGPGEILNAGCVSAPTTGATDLNLVPRPLLGTPETSAPGSYDLRVTTLRPLYEPMYELQLQIRCPGTALVVRQYVLMLDLPRLETQSAPAVSASSTALAVATASAEPSSMPVNEAAPTPARPPAARARRIAHPATPIASGSRYQVQKGDTLSTIAARVGDRGGAGIWQLADQIFVANPQAFIGSDQDLIKLGAEIDIPGAAAPAIVAKGEPLTTAPAEVPAPAVETPPAAVSEVTTPVESVVAPAGAEPATTLESPAPASSETIVAAGDAPAAVFQDEQSAPVAVEPTATAETAAPPADNENDQAPTWLAALVGVLIGIGVSFALLRKRLVEALLGLARRRGTSGAARGTAAAVATPVVTAAAQVARPFVPRESSMVVVEERQTDTDDDTAENEAAPDRTLAMRPSRGHAFSDVAPKSELASLFAEESDLSMRDTQSVGEPQADEELDLDLTGAATGMTADHEIGWIGDETELTPTQKTGALALGAGNDTVEQVDLQTLVDKVATGEQELSQTLKDALNLLESDYEDELTASQVIDRSKLQKMIDSGDDDDDTLVRTGTDRTRR